MNGSWKRGEHFKGKKSKVLSYSPSDLEWTSQKNTRTPVHTHTHGTIKSCSCIVLGLQWGLLNPQLLSFNNAWLIRQLWNRAKLSRMETREELSGLLTVSLSLLLSLFFSLSVSKPHTHRDACKHSAAVCPTIVYLNVQTVGIILLLYKRGLLWSQGNLIWM